MDKQQDFSSQSDSVLMVDAIKKVVRICNEHDVACWLNYGALLGMVREGRLLPWNNDAELCCWYEKGISTKFASIAKALNAEGYAAHYYSAIGALTVRSRGVNVNVNCVWIEEAYAVRPHETAASYAPLAARIFYWMGTLLTAVPAGLVSSRSEPLTVKGVVKSIAVTFAALIPRIIRRSLYLSLLQASKASGGRFQKTAIPKEFYSELDYLDFYGCEILSPADPEKLLAFIYGESWNIPKANWSFYSEANKAETRILYKDEPWDYANADFL